MISVVVVIIHISIDLVQDSNTIRDASKPSVNLAQKKTTYTNECISG